MALALLVLGYGAAGLIGGALPVNAGWRPPERGVTIWVESNGVHTGLVVPKVAAGVDWRPFAPSGDLADMGYAGHRYLAIGWGDRDFYLATPTWADVRPRDVLAAAVGGDYLTLRRTSLGSYSGSPPPSDSVQATNFLCYCNWYLTKAAQK